MSLCVIIIVLVFASIDHGLRKRIENTSLCTVIATVGSHQCVSSTMEVGISDLYEYFNYFKLFFHQKNDVFNKSVFFAYSPPFTF